MNKYQQLLLQRSIDTISRWKTKSYVENKELYRFFHSLKGTAASIELFEITNEAEIILEQLDETDGKVWTCEEWGMLMQDLFPLLNTSKTQAEEVYAATTNSHEQDSSLILLVDDDIDMVTSLKKELEKQGYLVLPALTAEKALKIYYDQKPDCVILGVHLPDRSGLDLLQLIVNKSYHSFTPVILIGTDPNREIRIKAYERGASDFIEKPIEINEFLARVKNRMYQKELIHNAILIDELTETFNRKFFTMEMDRQLQEYKRSKVPFSIVLIDLDHFKKINDTYGHITGDEVLRSLSMFMKENKRHADFFIRYGGEEFILLLPQTKKDQAKIVTQRLLKGFSKQSFWSNDERFQVTFSAGITEIADDKLTAEEYINQADQALYQIKEKGRNGVAVYNAQHKAQSVEKIVRIGVIDDDEIVRDVVTQQLNKLSLLDYMIDIQAYREGESFLQSDWHKQNGKFLIILDGVLPRMDGLEVLQKIRQHSNEKNVMVLMLTGRKTERDIVKALELGADDYLTKPFSVAELKARVRRLLLRMV
ncbi:diguanylate cyclase [Alkalihalobacterium sp. APHAB7]|uniref:diguanylate cyclase n=1 Tax=Alkalihalobacterium sp. APHAB7 TaxID=3402081 RepID=UPI003AAABB53